MDLRSGASPKDLSTHDELFLLLFFLLEPLHALMGEVVHLGAFEGRRRS